MYYIKSLYLVSEKMILYYHTIKGIIYFNMARDKVKDRNVHISIYYKIKYKYVYVCIYMYIHMNTCVCMYICIYVYTHIFINYNLKNKIKTYKLDFLHKT